MNRSKPAGGAGPGATGMSAEPGPGAGEGPEGLGAAADGSADPEMEEARRIAIEMGEARFAAIRRGYARQNASETGGRCPEAVALAGWRAGRSLREIAVELYGREEVEACWHDDSAMRLMLRRLLSRARARAGAGPEDGPEADTDSGLQ